MTVLDLSLDAEQLVSQMVDITPGETHKLVGALGSHLRMHDDFLEKEGRRKTAFRVLLANIEEGLFKLWDRHEQAIKHLKRLADRP